MNSPILYRFLGRLGVEPPNGTKYSVLSRSSAFGFWRSEVYDKSALMPEGDQRIAPVQKGVIDAYAPEAGLTLRKNTDAETLSGGMSLVASTGGSTLLPQHVRRHGPYRRRVFVVRHGPTIDMMTGYSKTKLSPLLKRFLHAPTSWSTVRYRARTGRWADAEQQRFGARCNRATQMTLCSVRTLCSGGGYGQLKPTVAPGRNGQ